MLIVLIIIIFLGSAKIDLFPRALGPNSDLFKLNLATGSPLDIILATSKGLTFLIFNFLFLLIKDKSYFSQEKEM